MKDVTDYFQRYINVCMPIWNLHFVRKVEQGKSENIAIIRDWFADIEGHIFYTTVTRPLGAANCPRLPRDHAYPYQRHVSWARVLPRTLRVFLCWRKDLPMEPNTGQLELGSNLILNVIGLTFLIGTNWFIETTSIYAVCYLFRRFSNIQVKQRH
jgi:hypothetical protein